MYCSPENSQSSSSVPLKKKYKTETETKLDMELGSTCLLAKIRKWPALDARNKINLSSKKKQHTVATSSKSEAKESPLARVTKKKADRLTDFFFFFSALPQIGSTSVYSSQATNIKAWIVLSGGSKMFLYLFETRTSVLWKTVKAKTTQESC